MAKRTASETLQVEYLPSDIKRTASLILQVEEVPFDNRRTATQLLMVELVIDPSIQANATLSKTLDDASAESAVRVISNGASSNTLDSATVSSSAMVGANVASGGLDAKLNDASFSSDAFVLVSGHLSKTLDGLSFISTTVAVTSGNLEKILADLTGRITGIVGIKGTLSKTLDILGLASSVEILGSDLSLNLRLEDVGIASTGNVFTNVYLSRTLEDLVVNSQGSTLVGGSVHHELAPLGIESFAKVEISGGFGISLEDATLSAEGVVIEPFNVVYLRVYVQTLLNENIQLRREEKLNVFTQSIYKSNSHF